MQQLYTSQAGDTLTLWWDKADNAAQYEVFANGRSVAKTQRTHAQTQNVSGDLRLKVTALTDGRAQTICEGDFVFKPLPERVNVKDMGAAGDGVTLETLPIGEYQKMTDLFDEDVYDAINLENCVMTRNSYGGPSPKAVTDQLDELRYELEQAIACFS